MGHSKTLNRFFLFALTASLTSPALASLKERAASEMDFLREAAKEVELYLPNEAYVNESEEEVAPQEAEIVDEISLKKAAPLRSPSVEEEAQQTTTTQKRRLRSR